MASNAIYKDTAKLDAVRPRLIVTLGNAALRVIQESAVTIPEPRIVKLSPDPTTYGQSIRLIVDGRLTTWLQLAHPAAPRAYQEAHSRWMPGSRREN